MNDTNHPIHLLLADMRSTHNVGSIFRTADSAGIDRIILSGTTPTPLDRFNIPRKDVAKVALGAEKTIPWEYAENSISIIKRYKKDGFQIIALEQSDRSIDYKEIVITKPTLIILGNEPKGIDHVLLRLVDVIAEIPMRGSKESLNVSVAAGVFLFRVLGI
jgi:tRNA G18 (ribose-2'-O)-methylase SpoU